MIKTVTLIFGMMLVAAVLDLPAFAEPREVLADWERNADRTLWGEKIRTTVAESVLPGERAGYALNANCDEATIEAFGANRRLLQCELASDIRRGEITPRTVIMADQLVGYGAAGIAPMQDGERFAVRAVYARTLSRGFSSRDLSASPKSSRNGEITLCGALVILNDNNHRVRVKLSSVTLKATDGRRCAVCAENVNLFEYSLDFAKVDIFGTVLYLWEENPILDLRPFGHIPLVSFPVVQLSGTVSLRNHQQPEMKNPIRRTIRADALCAHIGYAHRSPIISNEVFS